MMAVSSVGVSVAVTKSGPTVSSAFARDPTKICASAAATMPRTSSPASAPARASVADLRRAPE
jgi:hypothetical protein